MAEPTRVYVPREAAAISLGAHEIADRLAARSDVTVTRNGSWGASWLEPMLEVETGAQRIAYGPVRPADLDSLLAAGFLRGGDHPLKLGPTTDIPYLRDQSRWTFRRCGRIDPLSVDDYRAHGGLAGVEKALEAGPDYVLDQVERAGLRGRGGAGFPTGIKWRAVADATAERKFIACNADEGDSGTFSDRILMESDPFTLIEAMLIAGFATGASRGYIYLRSEYPVSRCVLERALDAARDNGWLGDDVLGSGFSFDIELHLGAGSYVCGEETAMLESLEGKAGLVRYKPPLPVAEGLFGQPTIVNNVVTLGSVPDIIAKGADEYAQLGVNRSKGTLAFQLAGNIRRGGLVETAFGISLRALIEDFGGGTLSGRPVRAVQVGGPLGAYLPAAQLDTPMDYEAFTEIGALIGHGGIVVFDDTVDMAAQARFAMQFCAVESCGKCTPCRIGSVRGVEVIDRIVENRNRDENINLLNELCDTMVDGSLCAMGGMTPYPVRSALKYFPEDFQR
jgi:formate dehydrogenase iron-sulfur subunit